MTQMTAGRRPASPATRAVVRGAIIFFGAHTLFVGLAMALGAGG